MQKVIHGIEQLSEWTGRVISWFTSVLVLLICYDVSMRYLVNETAVWFQELEWHFFALIFLVGAAYTLKHDQHVRVDVFYTRFSPRTQSWINLLGTIGLLIPFCMIMIKTSYGYAARAYTTMEQSVDPGGLPYRFLIKGAITLGFVLLLIQALAEILKSIQGIRGKTLSPNTPVSP